MKNHITEEYDQARAQCTGVLLTNLGTPNNPDTASVRKYLKEFLSDPRVVEVPRAAWWIVLNLVILNTRPRRSATKYKKIWTDQGSPLLTISQAQTAALNRSLEDRNIKVELGMRYGRPSLADGLDKLRRKGATRIVVLPLYPQYSATTTATTFDAIASEFKSWRCLPEMRFINRYHDNPKYIDALAQSIEQYWQQHDRAEILLMSFHGIPQQYVDQGDPYYSECQQTARLLAERLQLEQDNWQLSFQSRLGTKKWLQPYTDKTLKELAAQGTRSVQVVCPGFSVDCLETLEEIAMENRDLFLASGGEQYDYIPCLNDRVAHIEMMRQLVVDQTNCWN